MSASLRRAAIAASVALNLGFVGAFAARHVFSQGAHGPGFGHQLAVSDALADRLELDAATRAEIEALRAPAVAAHADFVAAATEDRRALLDAVAAGDAPAAEAARTRLMERQAAFQRQVVVYLAAVGARLDGRRRAALREHLEGALFPGLAGGRAREP